VVKSIRIAVERISNG